MHLMARKFLVIFGAEKADRLSPFNDDKPKRAKICRHKALRVRLSVTYEFFIKTIIHPTSMYDASVFLKFVGFFEKRGGPGISAIRQMPRRGQAQ